MKLRPFNEETYLELLIRARTKDAFTNFWHMATGTVLMKSEMISSNLGEMFFDDGEARKKLFSSNMVIPASENSIYVVVARRYDDLKYVDVIVPAVSGRRFYAPENDIERLKPVCFFNVGARPAGTWSLIPENDT